MEEIIKVLLTQLGLGIGATGVESINNIVDRMEKVLDTKFEYSIGFTDHNQIDIIYKGNMVSFKYIIENNTVKDMIYLY